jgi:uncharacterized protein YqfA (UPF0365 family)
MRLRRVPPHRIILPLIKADKAGIDVNQDQLEAHFLAGGNVDRVVDALIAADKARIALPFDRAAAIDLAGRDVLDAVKVSVNPRVIQTPNVSAVAKDGIELIATARVTVRANLERLVGGAGEETIIARVGEGIVSSIGSTATRTRRCSRTPTSSPRRCSRRASTPAPPSRSCRSTSPTSTSAATSAHSFRPTRPRPTSASPRRRRRSGAPWPSRSEQENRARVEEMRAKVVEAEAEVPRAIAEAFRQGNLGVMDYYNLQNIQSDTEHAWQHRARATWRTTGSEAA